MTLENSSLLPNGLKDLLPLEAEKEAYIINLLMEEFSKFGYSRVKPPLVEFEETLLGRGPGQALAKNTFRLMDPVSQRMMGLRADTTAQIARIANSRLSDNPRPLRLSYAVDVLKVNGTQLRPERQFCQVGCEMVGIETTGDDVELCLTALTALNKIQIDNITIDLTIPVLVEDLFTAFNVTDDQKEILNNLLQKRDRDGLVDIQSDVANCLVSLLDASGVAIQAITELEKITIPKQAENNIKKLKDVYFELSKALEIYGLSNVNVTIDLIERRGFDYQNGLSFTLFSKSVRGELGRGGHYEIYNSNDKNSSGFTLYMDSLLRASHIYLDENKKSVSKNTDWNEIKNLQNDGFQVTRQNN